MKPKEIEALVRQYAPVSLALSPELWDKINISDDKIVMSDGVITPETTLKQINHLIINEEPAAKPRWIRDGRVLHEFLKLKDLGDVVDVHPNRMGGAFGHQLMLLEAKIKEAICFRDVDDVYGTAVKMLKKTEDRTQIKLILKVLEKHQFWSNNLTEKQRLNLTELGKEGDNL